MISTIQIPFDEWATKYKSIDAQKTILEILNYLNFPNYEVGSLWLAGGSVRRFILKQNLDSNFDFFFKSEEVFNRFNDHLININGVYSHLFVDIKKNINNTTYTLTNTNNNTITQIQAITLKYYNSVVELLDSFDFTLCQFAIELTDDKSNITPNLTQMIVTTPYALHDTTHKRIVVHKIENDIVVSWRRLIKYTKQGFYACTGTLYEMAKAGVDKPELLNKEPLYID